jgi:hypothetical protein
VTIQNFKKRDKIDDSHFKHKAAEYHHKKGTDPYDTISQMPSIIPEPKHYSNHGQKKQRDSVRLPQLGNGGSESISSSIESSGSKAYQSKSYHNQTQQQNIPQYLTYSTLRNNGAELYNSGNRNTKRRMHDMRQSRDPETSWQSSFGVVGKPAGKVFEVFNS